MVVIPKPSHTKIIPKTCNIVLFVHTFCTLHTSSSPAKSEQPDNNNSHIPPSVNKTSKNTFTVPLPRQSEFDGTRAWEEFIHPFMGLAEACEWSAAEKKFRLVSSLKEKRQSLLFNNLTLLQWKTSTSWSKLYRADLPNG